MGAVSSTLHSWTTSDIPDLHGRHALVTGANSGIGYHTALELGRKGATVFLVCRDAGRGTEAVTRMRSEAPPGSFELLVGDISSQAEVKRLATDFNARGVALDILVNNAGIMMLPKRELSADGFEMQMATNHLGHFALTGRLLPSLLRSSSPRVVNVSSGLAWSGDLKKNNAAADFVGTDATYSPAKAYGNSKLANLVFTRMLAAKYPKLTVVASHPGGAATNLQKHAFNSPVLRMMMQSAATGALPSLRAATEPGLPSCSYYGPWIASSYGVPSNFYSWYPAQAKDLQLGAELWSASIAATGLSDF